MSEFFIDFLTYFYPPKTRSPGLGFYDKIPLKNDQKNDPKMTPKSSIFTTFLTLKKRSYGFFPRGYKNLIKMVQKSIKIAKISINSESLFFKNFIKNQLLSIINRKVPKKVVKK